MFSKRKQGFKKNRYLILKRYVKFNKISHMHIQTRIEPFLLDAVRQIADTEGIGISEYLRRLVEQDLKSRSGNPDSFQEDGGKSENQASQGR